MFIFRNDVTGSYVCVNKRMASGDLKVTQLPDGRFEVDQSDEWLFDWEKTDPKCHARRMQTKRFLPAGFEMNPMPDEQETP